MTLRVRGLRLHAVADHRLNDVLWNALLLQLPDAALIQLKEKLRARIALRDVCFHHIFEPLADNALIVRTSHLVNSMPNARSVENDFKSYSIPS